MQTRAQALVQSGFLPKAIKTSAQAMAIMQRGQELGIPPMQAFNQIHVIEGRVVVSPELMLALIFKNFPSASIEYIEYSKEVCRIKASRPGREPQIFQFTMDDARNAKLAWKDNWKNHPRAMLRSRCVAEMARALFPDAVMGASYTPEEMGAIVSENMEVIDANPVKEGVPPGPEAEIYDDRITQKHVVAQVCRNSGLTREEDMREVARRLLGKPMSVLDEIIFEYTS